MNQQQTQTTAEYKDVLLNRLLEQYLENRSIPDLEGKSLTPALFHRLFRAIAAEGYGQ
jgi:hypothetical protein